MANQGSDITPHSTTCIILAYLQQLFDLVK